MENVWLIAGASAGDGALRDLVALARAIQPLLLTAGGLWAVYLYRSSRRGEVRVGIQTSCRMIREWIPARSVLLVKLRIANTSSVIYRHREATATLFDARRQSGDGTVRLVPFAGADPVPPVYGDVVFDPGELAAGRAFVLRGGRDLPRARGALRLRGRLRPRLGPARADGPAGSRARTPPALEMVALPGRALLVGQLPVRGPGYHREF
jgi:hypothetical protein